MDEDLVENAQFKSFVSDPIVTLSVFNLLLNLFAGVSLKYMWKVINVLQFIVYYPLWQVYIPPKAYILMQEFRKLAFFEFLELIYKRDDENCSIPISNEDGKKDCNKMGFHRLGSEDFLKNSGVLIIIGVIILTSALIVVIGLSFIAHRIAKVKQLVIKVKKKIFWNAFIRYVFQSTIKL